MFCDSELQFGGWDAYQEDIVDETVQLEIDGQRACLSGGGEGQTLHVFEGDDAWYATAPEDGGVASDQIDTPVSASSDIGIIDVPSGTLTIALAYPPLNMKTDGDFADVEHREGELLHIPCVHKQLVVSMQHTSSGWRLRVGPARSEG